ncbi:sce7725 family protein [Salinisphaera sp. S4-8]|uniref:sce7725 family protein n=1 Tax=Salinisphaera sp. S4-8 TaxID=633357 RepID=UPI003341DDEC
MYYPYFRGKQFELIAIRETASLMAHAGFVPIIEPVRANFSRLRSALDSVAEAGGRAIVVLNPGHGQLAGQGQTIVRLLQDEYQDRDIFRPGFRLGPQSTIEQAVAFNDNFRTTPRALIHAGFTGPQDLAESLGAPDANLAHIFFDRYSSDIYRRNFAGFPQVLIRDGFVSQNNADYPPEERFSDLHRAWSEMGLQGFGDFLIVGDNYSDGGGPAYAVAIHLTYIDRNRDNVMFVRHFVSHTQGTRDDTAAKFAEALNLLVQDADNVNSQFIESAGLTGFRELYAVRHYPGLGVPKKLSMIHHIETLADFFSARAT